MITDNDIISKGFSLYTVSEQSASNPNGPRKDYISLAKVGKAEYLVLIELFTAEDEMKVKDFWNDPILFPEYYFVGKVQTVEELEKALSQTGFDTFEPIENDKIWLYR